MTYNKADIWDRYCSLVFSFIFFVYFALAKRLESTAFSCPWSRELRVMDWPAIPKYRISVYVLFICIYTLGDRVDSSEAAYCPQRQSSNNWSPVWVPDQNYTCSLDVEFKYTRKSDREISQSVSLFIIRKNYVLPRIHILDNTLKFRSYPKEKRCHITLQCAAQALLRTVQGRHTCALCSTGTPVHCEVQALLCTLQ